MVAAAILPAVQAGLSALGGGTSLAGLGSAASSFGSLFSGIGSVFGGGGGGVGKANRLAEETEKRQQALAYQTAENMPSYLRAGAEKAGYHPLAVLGLNPSSGGSSIQVGGGSDRNIISDLGDMGQNIGRAIHAMGTKEERAMGAVAAQQALERGHLENELLKSQIAQIRATSIPSFPNGDSSGDGHTVMVPTEYHKKMGTQQKGSIKKSYFQVVQSPWGQHVLPSDDMLRAMESDFTQIPQWYAHMAMGAAKNAGRATGDWIRKKWKGGK